MNVVRETICPVCVRARKRQVEIEVRRKLQPVRGRDGEEVMVSAEVWHCPECGAEGVFTTERPRPRCDFCGAFDPVVAFPCRDFDYDGQKYLGAFAACQSCREMVEADDREGLISRSIYNYASHNPEGARRLLARGIMPGSHSRQLHRRFFEHRIRDAG